MQRVDTVCKCINWNQVVTVNCSILMSMPNLETTRIRIFYTLEHIRKSSVQFSGFVVFLKKWTQYLRRNITKTKFGQYMNIEMESTPFTFSYGFRTILPFSDLIIERKLNTRRPIYSGLAYLFCCILTSDRIGWGGQFSVDINAGLTTIRNIQIGS